MTQARQNTGKHGEALAADFLRQRAYHILETNWRMTGGEIDIVARKDNTLIFVEVRTRRAPSTAAAFASITPNKRNKLIKSAYAYMHTHNISDGTLWRIDIIAVALWNGQQPQIDHAEDALGW